MSLTQRTDRRCCSFAVLVVCLIWNHLVPLVQCFDHARNGLVAGNSKNLGHTMIMVDDDGDENNIFHGTLNGQTNAAVYPNWKDYHRHHIPGHDIKTKSNHGELNPINHNDNDTKDDDDYSTTGIFVGKNLHINNHNGSIEKRKKLVHRQKMNKFYYYNNKTQSKWVVASARMKVPNGPFVVNGNMDWITIDQNPEISEKPKNKEQKTTTTTTMMMMKQKKEEKDSDNSMKVKNQQRLQNNNHNNNGKNMENVFSDRFNLFHSKPDPLSWFWPSSSKHQWIQQQRRQEEGPNRKRTTTTVINNNNENELSFCLDVKCGPDEYCFIPEAGVAECLKKENVKKLEHETVHGRHRNNNIMINRPTTKNNNNKWSNLMDLEDNDDEDEDDVLFQDDVDYDQHYEKIKKNGNNLDFHKKRSENKKKNQDSHRRTSLAANLWQNHQTNKISYPCQPKRIQQYQEPRTNGDGNQIKNANDPPKSFTNVATNKTKIIQCPSCPFTYGQIVCGTNNVTYSSMCRVEFYNCVHEANVKFACYGYCPCTTLFNHHSNQPKPSRVEQIEGNSVDHPEILLLDQQNRTKHGSKARESLRRYHYDLVRFRSGSPKNCSPEELHSMGVRLLDWFLVVMREEIKHSNNKSSGQQSLPSSNRIPIGLPECEEQVSFMFYHFDLDHDFKLTTKELYYLRHDENEHCLEPYLLQCDEDRDDLLSAHEWCSCFDFRSKPCLYHIKQIEKNNPNGMKTTQYVPQCDQNGHYLNVQCNPVYNYCWCADKNGNEIAGTGVHGRSAICDKVYPLSLNKKTAQTPTPQQQQQQQQQQAPRVLNLDQERKVRSKVSANPVWKPLANSKQGHDQDDDDDDDESGDDGDDDDDEDGSFSMDRGSGLDSF